MKSFLVSFAWKLRTTARYFNAGETVIAVDAKSISDAKGKARGRFPDKILRFKSVVEMQGEAADH